MGEALRYLPIRATLLGAGIVCPAFLGAGVEAAEGGGVIAEDHDGEKGEKSVDDGNGEPHGDEIGRASCRERVCLSV